MTELTRGKDVGGAPGAGNDGSFASKGQTAPEVDLTATPTNTTAADAFSAAQDAHWEAERQLQRLAESAIREAALNEYPTARTATFSWDFDGSALNLDQLSDENGEAIDGSEELEDLNEFASAFGDYDTVRKLSGFAQDEDDWNTFALDLVPEASPAPTVEQRLEWMSHELYTIGEAQSDLQAREGKLGVESLTLIAKRAFPDAATLIIRDANYDGEGGACHQVARVEDAQSKCLWNYDDGDDNLADDFAEYAPLLDRAGDALRPAGLRDDEESWIVAI